MALQLMFQMQKDCFEKLKILINGWGYTYAMRRRSERYENEPFAKTILYFRTVTFTKNKEKHSRKQ